MCEVISVYFAVRFEILFVIPQDKMALARGKSIFEEYGGLCWFFGFVLLEFFSFIFVSTSPVGGD